MKRLTIIFVFLFWVIIFLVPNVSALDGPGQVITGKFEAYDSMDGMGKIFQVSIVGSGNISPSGCLETLNFIPEADQGAINDAFINFAESLNCTVGNPYEPNDPTAPPVPGRTAISFVCIGGDYAINKAYKILSFPLTFEANAVPIN